MPWCGCHHHTTLVPALVPSGTEGRSNVDMGVITVFLADDNVIIREGVRAMLEREPDLEVVGVGRGLRRARRRRRSGAPRGDRHRHPHAAELPAGGHRRRQGDPQAPSRHRRRDPAASTTIPTTRSRCSSEGAAGYAYLLKDRIAEGDQLARAIREVATGGSMLDPAIVERAGAARCAGPAGSTPSDEELLEMVAEGKPIKAIAAAPHTTPAAVADARRAPLPPPRRGRVAPAPPAPCERLRGSTRRSSSARSRARRSAACCRRAWPRSSAPEGTRIGETERLEVTVLMSDIRGYSTIAEHADPSQLAAAAQQPPGRDEPCHPRRGRHRDAVRRRRRDGGVRRAGAVASITPTAPRRGRSADARRAGRRSTSGGSTRVCRRSGSASGCPPATVAAALLGSEERLEYTLVGDTVNLCQRLQQFADRARPCSARRRGRSSTVTPDASRSSDQPREGPIDARSARTASCRVDQDGAHEQQQDIRAVDRPRAVARDVVVDGSAGLPHVRARTPRRCGRCGAPTSTSAAASSSP